MAGTSIEDLQRAAFQNHGMDYPGALRKVSTLDMDPNGIALALFNKELYAALPELYTLLGGV